MLNQLKVAGAPGLCKQSAEGSLMALIRRPVFLPANRLLLTHGAPKMAKPFLTLVLLVSHWGAA